MMRVEDLLKKVRRFSFQSKQMSRHLAKGNHKTVFKGQGMTFAEVRAYQYGDDVRNMDWNVTARTNTPHIKIFEEERENTLLLMVDKSASMLVTTDTQAQKQQAAAEIAATLALAAADNNDKVGLIIFTDTVEQYIPPKKGKNHILLILKTILDFSPQAKKTNITQAINFFQQTQQKQTVGVLIADFNDMQREVLLKKKLGILSQTHDIIAIKINDDLEQNFPNVGLLPCEDAENGDIFWLDTADKRVTIAIKENFDAQKSAFEQLIKQTKARKLIIRTSENYLKALFTFFRHR
jgi:uncharacterized protein (DUF58 family)